MADLFNPPNPRHDRNVALAVQVLRAGGARGDALRVLLDLDEPPALITALLSVATFVGGRHYGGVGAFMAALGIWERTGELPEPSTPNYLPRLFRDFTDLDDRSGRDFTDLDDRSGKHRRG